MRKMAKLIVESIAAPRAGSELPTSAVLKLRAVTPAGTQRDMLKLNTMAEDVTSRNFFMEVDYGDALEFRVGDEITLIAVTSTGAITSHQCPDCGKFPVS